MVVTFSGKFVEVDWQDTGVNGVPCRLPYILVWASITAFCSSLTLLWDAPLVQGVNNYLVLFVMFVKLQPHKQDKYYIDCQL